MSLINRTQFARHPSPPFMDETAKVPMWIVSKGTYHQLCNLDAGITGYMTGSKVNYLLVMLSFDLSKVKDTSWH